MRASFHSKASMWAWSAKSTMTPFVTHWTITSPNDWSFFFAFRSSRMPDPHHHHHQQCDPNDNNEFVHDTIPEDDISPHHSRPGIHWRPDLEGDVLNVKEQINTDADQFDALFARSNASPPPSPHPRCYSSTSPSTRPAPFLTESPSHLYAKSQPHLIFSSSSSSPSAKAFNDRRRSLAAASSSSSVKSQTSNPSLLSSSAQMKRKNFSVPHAGQAFLQSSTSPCEQSEPLARSCSYKRPQSIKKYRQQKKGKEKEEKEYSASPSTSSRKYSTQNNNVPRTVTSDSARKSISSATSRISATDLMANDDQWSSPKPNRSARIGKIKSIAFLFLAVLDLNTSLISHPERETQREKRSRERETSKH